MVDLSNYTFADWMNFTFGHPVDLNRPWFSGEFFLYDFDSKLILEHLTSFFSRPELGYLLYTPEQIDQGLGFIVSDRGFLGVLLDQSIPLRLRRECIMEMGTLFRFHMEQNPDLPSNRIWWREAVRNCRYQYQHLYLHVDILRYFFRILCRLLDRKTILPRLRLPLEEGLLELKRTAPEGLRLAQDSRKRIYTRAELRILDEVLRADLDDPDSADAIGAPSPGRSGKIPLF